MDQPSQNIDISPQVVAPIANAGLKLLNLETTLVPGNLRGQLGMLEVYLSGLATGQIVLAPAPEDAVESNAKKQLAEPTGKQNDGGAQTNIRGGGGESPSKA